MAVELTIEQYKDRVCRWLRKGKERGSTHVIIALDMKSKSPLPVYVGRSENVQQKIKNLNDDINTNAVEVYNLNMDLSAQLGQGRAWNT